MSAAPWRALVYAPESPEDATDVLAGVRASETAVDASFLFVGGDRAEARVVVVRTREADRPEAVWDRRPIAAALGKAGSV